MKKAKLWSWLFLGGGLFVALYIRIKSGAISPSVIKNTFCNVSDNVALENCEIETIVGQIFSVSLSNLGAIIFALVGALVLCVCARAFIEMLKE